MPRRLGSLLAAMTLALLCTPAAASEKKWGRPDQQLAALPAPPRDAEEALRRWVGATDREVEPIRRAARARFETLAPEKSRGLGPADLARLGGDDLMSARALEESLIAEAVVIPRRFAEQVAGPRDRLRVAVADLDRGLAERFAECGEGPALLGCRRAALDSARAQRIIAVGAFLIEAGTGWRRLREDVGRLLAQRQQLAERIVTGKCDPALVRQAHALQARSWGIVAGLAEEVALDTRMAADLSH